jgi:hypothetical protein
MDIQDYYKSLFPFEIVPQQDRISFINSYSTIDIEYELIGKIRKNINRHLEKKYKSEFGELEIIFKHASEKETDMSRIIFSQNDNVICIGYNVKSEFWKYLMLVLRNLNPGSKMAIRIGCTCPVIDNHYGLGFNYGSSENLFVYNSECPIHGVSK